MKFSAESHGTVENCRKQGRGSVPTAPGAALQASRCLVGPPQAAGERRRFLAELCKVSGRRSPDLNVGEGGKALQRTGGSSGQRGPALGSSVVPTGGDEEVLQLLRKTLRASALRNQPVADGENEPCSPFLSHKLMCSDRHLKLLLPCTFCCVLVRSFHSQFRFSSSSSDLRSKELFLFILTREKLF